MGEKIISIEDIEVVDLFGVNNSKLERIQQYFSKLKIILRGNTLKIIGEPGEIQIFESKYQLMLDHVVRYNHLSNNDLEQILLNDFKDGSFHPSGKEEALLFGNNGKMIRGRTTNQLKMIEESRHSDLIIAIGPAGTGKTYTAIALAVRALKNRQVKRLVLSRPAVEAGENLGFLPGDLKEKIDPYLQPLYDALNDMIPSKKLKDLMEEGVIQIAPLAFMRGRTLENAFVILDEAQNATYNQLKMFLTRMGMNTQFIVTGDITQIDLPRRSQSGLLKALPFLEKIKDISVIRFNQGDIVRHPLVKKIVDAYEQQANKQNNDTKEMIN